ncbi:hypothetical protein [Planococcus sp. YIM B11945]|uniref:hypothetical protein n=1 Tax=Planococcus sp. YIM B11945 TaxID=3435410 RepID=UPI003D7E5125
MEYKDYIKQGLELQGLPVTKIDIPFIFDMLATVRHAQTALLNFPEVKSTVPMAIVDKEEILRD